MEDGKITLVEDDLVNAAYRVTRRLVKKIRRLAYNRVLR